MHIENALIAATKKWDDLTDSAMPRKKIAPMKQWVQYQKIKRAMKKCFNPNTPMSFKSLSESKATHRLAEMFLQMPVPGDLHADYVIVTENFIKRAQTQCPHLSDEDVFQALRNVWIMVLIQVLSENPVRLTNAMFAYSMLYPLTDNVTDDPTLSEPFKHHFIKRFGKRLHGDLLSPENAYESHVFDMIGWIEKDYPRDAHPKVYDSLMAIFEAQKKSLSQQYQALSIDAIKKITFEKGATSVVADGFLVLGDLEEAMFIFLTDYGIALQLSDDLQDMACDAEQSHQTLFNTSENLDALMGKLFHFTDRVLEQVPKLSPNRGSLIKRLLEVSTTALYSDAIFTHKNCFSKAFIQSVHRSHPMGLTHHKKLKTYALTCFSSCLMR